MFSELFSYYCVFTRFFRNLGELFSESIEVIFSSKVGEPQTNTTSEIISPQYAVARSLDQ